jgi:hypothetical protein
MCPFPSLVGEGQGEGDFAVYKKLEVEEVRTEIGEIVSVEI